MLLNYMIDAVIVSCLDHGSVLAAHIWSGTKLLESSVVLVLWSDQLGLHGIRY